MSRRDVAAAEEMVAIKKAVSDGWHREPRVSVKNNKWRSLRQSLSAAFIASKSRKHPDSWQSVCSVYKASHKWLRFSPSCCLSFFGCWVGGVETMTGNLLVFGENLKFRNDYTSSQQRKREHLLHIPLMSVRAKCLFPHSNYHSYNYIPSTRALRSAVWLVVF